MDNRESDCADRYGCRDSAIGEVNSHITIRKSSPKGVTKILHHREIRVDLQVCVGGAGVVQDYVDRLALNICVKSVLICSTVDQG